MVLITKEECLALEKQGFKFGQEGILHHTYSKHKTYYMTESKSALAALRRIRESRIVK